MAKFGALDQSVLGSHTEREWLDLLNQWNWRCFYCGEPVQRNSPDPYHEATKDHMVPISRGGVDYITNIAPACLRCNLLKGDKTSEEFRAERAWVIDRKSTGNLSWGAPTGDAQRPNPSSPPPVVEILTPAPILPTLEVAAMWKKVVQAKTINSQFPAEHTPEWYAERRSMLKAQADAMIKRRAEDQRYALEKAGQLVLPIFGSGLAKKLAEGEAATLPFQGMDLERRA